MNGEEEENTGYKMNLNFQIKFRIIFQFSKLSLYKIENTFVRI
jgi:hypothetical protein